MGRSPTFDKGLKKGPWTPEEDQKLVAYIEEHGHGSWRALPLKAGLLRCGKSCRLRWTNYLRPDIKRGKFSLQEEQTIMQLHALLGNRWSAIATHLPRRTDNEIKNYWNTHLKKRLTKMGIDPITHKSKTMTTANLSHMTQWETARLEAEARLVRKSRHVSNFYERIRRGSAPLTVNKPLVPPVLQPQLLCLDVLKAWEGIISRNSFSLSARKPPDSTLNFSEKTLPSLPSADNQSVPVMNLVENTEPTIKDCNNDLEVSKDPAEALESSKDDKTPNALQASDTMYQDGYLMEALTNCLANNASNGNYGDFEEDNDCWSTILNNLGNNVPFSSVF